MSQLRRPVVHLGLDHVYNPCRETVVYCQSRLRSIVPKQQWGDRTNKFRSTATLCLRAGQRAVLSSDFKTTLRYFELDDTFLDTGHKWINHYSLTLCCVADFDSVENIMVSIFMMNARCFDDKLRRYTPVPRSTMMWIWIGTLYGKICH
jgi:hypothetical protein